ncbi:lysophospholipid acyltransferase family protein [Chitinimonas sp. PSY-7]|uniref:1-acyl-sn-glycerol-3-phosphate acyltransferase n=1 Tax=Chitinimonas sp. PSY-7 TaxID=3459088 RepID=UPI0040400E3F
MKIPFLIPYWRLTRLTIHFMRGLLEVGLIFPIHTSKVKEEVIIRWSRQLCQILNIRTINNLICRPHNTMLVANHVSWLDIFVLNSVFASRFVAKAEVRHWPFIGWLCHQTGTLFIVRERRHDTRRVNKEIADALANGDCVAVFPEGITSSGLSTSTFNASLLQPAVDANAQVLAVALSYYDQHGNRTDAAAYIGEMTLFDSVWRLIHQPVIEVELQYFPTISAGQLSRKEIAHQVQQLINDHIRS